MQKHPLWRRLNYKHIRLDGNTLAERVGVLQRDGSLRFVAWCGFLDPETARAIPNAQSVRLAIYRIGSDILPPGRYVLGCCRDDRAWAIVDHSVRVVDGPVREQGHDRLEAAAHWSAVTQTD